MVQELWTARIPPVVCTVSRAGDRNGLIPPNESFISSWSTVFKHYVHIDIPLVARLFSTRPVVVTGLLAPSATQSLFFSIVGEGTRFVNRFVVTNI